MRKQPLGINRPGGRKKTTKKTTKVTRASRTVSGTAATGDIPRVKKKKKRPRPEAEGARNRQAQRPKKKDNTPMFIVLGVAGVMILATVIFLLTSEDKKKKFVYADPYSAAKADIDKRYNALNKRYSAFVKISGGKSHSQKVIREAMSMKKSYNALIDQITKFIESSPPPSRKQKEAAKGWQVDAQLRRRQLASFLQKHA